MNEREERLGEFVVAGGDASELLETSEESFDEIARPVEVAIEIPRGKAVGARRDNRLRASSLDPGDEVIGVVPLAGNHCLSRQVFDQLGGVVDVGNLSGRQNYPQRIAQGVDRNMQLGRQPAPRAPDLLTPCFFLAPAECWWVTTLKKGGAVAGTSWRVMHF